MRETLTADRIIDEYRYNEMEDIWEWSDVSMWRKRSLLP